MVVEFKAPVELTDAELDAVTGGAPVGGLAQAVGAAAGGLVAAGVAVAAAVPVSVQENNIAIGILAAQAQDQ
jgi:hypothetical protein